MAVFILSNKKMANKPISKFQEWFSKSIKGKVIKPTQLWSLDKGLDDDEYAFDQRGAVKIYGPTSFLKNKNHRGVAEMKFKGMGEVGASNGLSIPRPGSGKFVDSSRAMDAHFGWVYAAIKAIADEVSNIEFKLYEIDKAGEHGEVLEHELLDLLGGVNDFQTGPEFRHTLISHLELTGNAYIYLMGVINFNSKPKGMFLLNPSRMKVKLNQMSYPYKVVGYEMTLDGRIFQYQPYEIIHIKYPDPSDPWHGLGTVQGIAEWIDNDNYATEFLRQFFSNGARIMGIFETDMTDEEQLQELKDSFEERYAGVKNAYKTMAMPKGVKFIPVQQNLTDIGLPQLTENARDRILAGFRVSKTILGTAESDTNRATAETADYVFSKRTIKPKMQLIISYLNEFLVPRYDDKIYLAFVDPVPEDKAFRTTEMQAAVGQKQVITQNEAREEFMGLGPVDEPAADTITAPATPAGGDNAAADDDNNGDAPPTPKKLEKKTISKDRIVRPEFRKGAIKTQFSRNAVKRQEIFSALTEKMKELVEKAKKKSVFEMNDIEYAEVVLKDSTERGNKAEKELIGKIKGVNAEQKKEVMDNVKKYFSTKSKKDFTPASIFNLKNWINIFVDATTPVIADLFKSEATDAAAGVGKPELDVFNTPAAQTAIKSSVGLMAQSYNETTLATLTEKLNEGLSAGYGYQQTADLVSDIYTWQDDYAALRVAKTETVRIMNTANKTAWQQSGVVETLKWYTSPLDNVCEFCKDMDGTTIDINDNFFNQGDALTLDDGSSMSMDYSDIVGPPLHPNCNCRLRPDKISSVISGLPAPKNPEDEMLDKAIDEINHAYNRQSKNTHRHHKKSPQEKGR